MCRPVSCSRARMAAVASKPSISGICTSISTTSNVFLRRGRPAPPGRCSATTTVWPSLLQQADGQPLVDRVVLGQQDAQSAAACAAPGLDGRRGVPVGVVRRRAKARSGWHPAGRTAGWAWSGRRRRPARGSGPRRRDWSPDEQHHERGARPASGPARIRSASGEAVHLRHHGIQQHQGERLAGSLRSLAGRPGPRGPLSTSVGCMSQLSSISSRIRRLVALSSTTSTGRPCSLIGCSRLRLAAACLRPPKRAVKWNVLPWPGSLSTQIRPPISPTSCARDGQAQPGAAVLAASSSCRPGRRPRRSAVCFSGGMPMPVSRTGKCRKTGRQRKSQSQGREEPLVSGRGYPLSARPARTARHDHLALLGELDGVAHQVDDDLAQPVRVARPGPSGTSGAMWQASSRPFCGARMASVLQGVADSSRAGRSRSCSRSSLPASILEKSRMSLITVSSESADDFDQSRGTRAARRSARCPAASSVMPMMPFIGVRISWLMLARNSLLARLAASAAVAGLAQLGLHFTALDDLLFVTDDSDVRHLQRRRGVHRARCRGWPLVQTASPEKARACAVRSPAAGGKEPRHSDRFKQRRMSAGSRSLLRKASAPASSPRSTLTGSAWAVSTTTGRWRSCGSALIAPAQVEPAVAGQEEIAEDQIETSAAHDG